MNIKGIITAAGAFQAGERISPAAELNGFPLIRLAVQSMKNAGVEDICVIAGTRIGDTEKALSGMDISLCRGPEDAAPDTLAAIKPGLELARGADAVFLLPGDMPLVTPGIFKALKEGAAAGAEVMYPVHAGQRTAPVLIKQKCIDEAISYRGDGGLEAALSGFKSEGLYVDDESVVLRAGMSGLEKLSAAVRARCGVSQAVCEALYEEANLMEHIREHCRAVGELSRHIAQTLVRCGYFLDIELCASAGALHDITKLSVPHEATGARFLSARGYKAIADIVKEHSGFYENRIPDFTESAIVCLADKLVRDTERVTVRERYLPVAEQYLAGSPARRIIMMNIDICEEMVRRYGEITGENLERK